MCDFKPGDEVVCIAGGDWLGPAPRWMFWARSRPVDGPRKGCVYVVASVGIGVTCITEEVAVGLSLVGVPKVWPAVRFRKVQRRKTDLSIETFLTIRPGFEEPRRSPAPTRKRERVS